MKGGVMDSGQAASGAIYSPPSLLFSQFPAAASVPGQYRIASDLNNATLRSDGTYWSPANGHAVIANAYNVNLTIQSIAEALITSVSFPANFVRAGSRIRIWQRWAMPSASSANRYSNFRLGSVGAGLSGGLANSFITGAAGAVSQVELLHLTTALSANGITRQSTTSNIGLHDASSGSAASLAPSVDFTVPWEIAFTGSSCAESAKTINSASWAANVVTFGYAAAHGYAVGDKIVVSGMTPAGYNGTYTIVSTPLTTSWTAALLSDPGAATVFGSSARTSNVTLVDYYVEWLQ